MAEEGRQRRQRAVPRAVDQRVVDPSSGQPESQPVVTLRGVRSDVDRRLQRGEVLGRVSPGQLPGDLGFDEPTRLVEIGDSGALKL